MKPTLIALLFLLAGCNRNPCKDRAVLIGPDSLEDDRILCDARAAVSVEETSHGLMLMCSCPRAAHL